MRFSGVLPAFSHIEERYHGNLRDTCESAGARVFGGRGGPWEQKEGRNQCGAQGDGKVESRLQERGIYQRCVTEGTNYLNSSKTLPVKSPDSPCPGKPCVQDTLKKLLILSSSCLEFPGEH